MTDVNKTNNEPGQQQEPQEPQQAQNTEPEKKYSDDEVNAISKKNSDKAVAKLLKELGIDATDEGRAKAKQILSDAKAQAEAAKGEKTKAAETDGKLSAAIARANLADATLALIGKGVPADKAARFAKLLDLSEAVTENGDIDPDKMGEAVDVLLKEWPEALPKADSGAGFKIGSNGKETKSDNADEEMEKWRKAAGLK